MALAEKIAVDYWRLRRLLHSETGEFREELHRDEAGRRDLSVARDMPTSAPASAQIRLRESSLGLEYLKKARTTLSASSSAISSNWSG